MSGPRATSTRGTCTAQTNCPRDGAGPGHHALGLGEEAQQGACRDEPPTRSAARSGPGWRVSAQSPRAAARTASAERVDERGTASRRPLFGRVAEGSTGWWLQEGKPRRATGRRQPATAARRNGLSRGARPRGQQAAACNGEEATAGGDTGTATREGKALEGEASEGRPTTDHQQVARRGLKPGEPQGRLQDATSLRATG